VSTKEAEAAIVKAGYLRVKVLLNSEISKQKKNGAGEEIYLMSCLKLTIRSIDSYNFIKSKTMNLF
jgi:hypothetical protein